MSEITPLIAGNWKMNGLGASLGEVDRLAALVDRSPQMRADIVLCPPATLLAAATARLAGTGIFTGGQDCHQQLAGPHTGDVSAPMLADAGASFVILGHSERRAEHCETDEMVRAKALSAISTGLVPIICVGENLAERDAGQAEAAVLRQLAGSVPDLAGDQDFVVAYEPVWAIGTGTTPDSAEIADMHAAIRQALQARFGKPGEDARILYGGSLDPSNAHRILSTKNVNGGLVGRASLLSSEFFGIISAL